MTQDQPSPRRYFGAETDLASRIRCNLFVLCPNNSGSTYLSKTIATSPDVWSLPREGQHALGFRGPVPDGRAALLWAADDGVLAQLRDRDAFDWAQNAKAWYFQAQATTASASVFLAKAPPFLAYTAALQDSFANCRFVIMVRNPYPVVEAILRHERGRWSDHVALVDRACAHLITCLEMQRHNQVTFGHISVFFTYEELCANPTETARRIMGLVPEIQTLDLDQVTPVKQRYRERLRNMNADQIARLSRAEIDRIGQAFEPHQELLAHFGYDLIASSGG